MEPFALTKYLERRETGEAYECSLFRENVIIGTGMHIMCLVFASKMRQSSVENKINALLKMVRYYSTTMCHYWDM